MQTGSELGRIDANSDAALLELERASLGGNLREAMMQKSEVVGKICAIVAGECKTAFGERLASLVLTGSAARDEVTISNVPGGWKLLSDTEFLVVVHRNAGTDERAIESAKRQSAVKLRDAGIDVCIDLAVVVPSYFGSLSPTIFSCELRLCGRVITGDAHVLDLIPKFTINDISREDAWRLLCNRMIEQLEFVDDLQNSPTELTSRLHYATVKLYLDIATSYLIFAGQYAPTYSERAKRLSALTAQRNDAVPFPLAKFAARVAECTSWKLSGDEESFEQHVEFWQEAISYMRRLWRWEMIQLTSATDELTVAALSREFATQQTANQRLRGWISFVKRDGWMKSLVRGPHLLKLASRATPRYLVYQAAAEIAFRLPCLIKHDGQPPRLDLKWDEIQNLLPQRAPRSTSGSRLPWRRIVDDILWNYSQFLRSTRA